jgi:hypothetical protein
MSHELAVGHERPLKTKKGILMLSVVLSATVLSVHTEAATKPLPSGALLFW